RLRSGIPPRLEAVVLKALEKDPAARFQSAPEMGAGLEAARLSPTEPLPQPTAVLTALPTAPMRSERSGRRRRWWPLAAIVAGLIVLGAGLAAGFAAGGSQPLAPPHTSPPPSAPAPPPPPSVTPP